jgi:hypothetical protein
MSLSSLNDSGRPATDGFVPSRVLRAAGLLFAPATWEPVAVVIRDEVTTRRGVRLLCVNPLMQRTNIVWIPARWLRQQMWGEFDVAS